MARTTLVAAFWVLVSSLSISAQPGSSANVSQDVLKGDVLQQILVELRSVRQALDRTLVLQTQLLLWSEQVKISYQLMTTKGERVDGVRARVVERERIRLG